jgi:hypothetical protein
MNFELTAAGVTDHLRSLEDVIAKIDAMAPAPAKRCPYKKRAAGIHTEILPGRRGVCAGGASV